jgi:hypothetical protein
MRPCFQFTLVLLCGVSPTAFAKDAADTSAAARTLIERAIAAQGGKEQVAKLTRAWHAKVKGTAGPLQITGTMSHQGPDRGRITTQIEHGEKTIEVIAVSDGERAWAKIDGKTREVTGKELDEMRDGGWRSRRVRFLLPLLTEEGIELTVLGGSKVADRPATRVRVKSQGHRDIDIFFDNESGLLVKTESRVKSPDNRDMVLEQVFSDYKDFDGLKLATTFTKYENGRQTSVEQITDLTFVDRLDPKEYARP